MQEWIFDCSSCTDGPIEKALVNKNAANWTVFAASTSGNCAANVIFTNVSITSEKITVRCDFICI